MIDGIEWTDERIEREFDSRVWKSRHASGSQAMDIAKEIRDDLVMQLRFAEERRQLIEKQLEEVRAAWGESVEKFDAVLRSERQALDNANWSVNLARDRIRQLEQHVADLEKKLPQDDPDLREALAEYAHHAWSGWMKYLFSKCDTRIGYFSNGEVICIPAWAVERWTRQMNTPYADLPQEEKESDRVEADAMLAVIRAHKEEKAGDA